MKKICSLLVSVAIMASMAVTAFAAGNFTATPSVTEVQAGDTFTVSLDLAGVTCDSVSFSLGFDKDAFECTSITVNSTNMLGMMINAMGVKSTTDEANNTGWVGFGLSSANVNTYTAANMATIGFTVKADATAGAKTFTVSEQTGGSAGYIGDCMTTDVIVKGNEPVVTDTITVSDKAVADAVATWNVTLSDIKLLNDLKVKVYKDAADENTASQESAIAAGTATGEGEISFTAKFDTADAEATGGAEVDVETVGIQFTSGTVVSDIK